MGSPQRPDEPEPSDVLRALRESEERFRTICEHAPVMIDQFDEHGRCLLWNRECERTLGYTREEIEASDDPLALAYPDPDDRHRVLDAIVRADGRFREYRVRAKNGSTRIQRWADLRLPTGALISVGYDVTELRDYEDQLRRSQKMEAIGQLAGGIAHDFNNLLTVIQTNVDLADRRTAAGDTNVRDLLREVRQATQRGGRLVRKLLAFSRQERLHFAPVDLNELVAEIVPTLRRLLPETIVIDLVTDDRLTAIRADAGAVEQIILNLATNARDALTGQGRLRLATERRELSDDECRLLGLPSPGRYGVLSVCDTGAGMDRDTRARAFEPFFTTKPPGVGSGLGLPMVYGLARQHDGAAELSEAPTGGTTVRVYFPECQRPVTAPPDPEPVVAAGDEAEVILLVEDEEPIRTAAQALLQDSGYEVLTAGDGVEALEVIRARPGGIDLVVTDVIMPRMSGGQLYAEVKDMDHAPRFLLTSGYPTRDASAGTDLDASVRVFPKPWSADELLAEIRSVLDATNPP